MTGITTEREVNMSGARASNAGPDAIAAPTRGNAGPGSSWLADAVIYEMYPQLFADSNADGIGDLSG